ncbi:hypothetical protein CAPTEDRAFT_215733 [Capitella teleta]|uniref:Protein SPT2 homolog n=1 Tax=Capitella teleta TaxID=283909 RepID=R7VB03_CAPTE|nr:hypothetical protein CAPTEDRAFT_215733 [Capitella teleta]|eukprot:ELU15789.1 hypothetical protein CAPTEDRAFT_215733 [Capitella teleta]
MDYSRVISKASTNEGAAKKNPSTGKVDSRKSHTEKPAIPQSGAVKAFLQKREEQEKRQAEEAKRKKAALIAARVEANTAKTTRAMSSRTKDNLKVFEFGGKTETTTAQKPKQTGNQENVEPELDTVEFGGKSKRRVARMSDAEILETRKRLEATRRSEAAKKNGSSSDSDKKVENKCGVLTSRRSSSNNTSSTPKSSCSFKTNNHKSSHHLQKEKHKDRKKEKEKKKEKPKVAKRNQGPPMSFEQLMSIASTNQDKSADGVEKATEKPKDKPQRPMTQEEKDRIERRKSKEYQHWLKHGGKMPALPLHDKKTRGRPEPSSKAPSSVNPRPQKPMEKLKVEEVAEKKMKATRPQKNGHSAVGSNSSSKYGIVNEIVISCGRDNSRKRPSHDDDDDDDDDAEKPQSTWDRIYNKVHKPKAPAKRQRIESEDEMDEYEDDFVEEDDDDFIDDSEAVDYSSAIRDIFGYDKRKYRNEREDDIRDMETNFAQISREEKISARIGLKEDLEDIKREQKELRMKALLKKKRGRY